MVFWLKKMTAPASDSLRISAARVAIQLNMENPVRVLKTNKAIACCRKRPTMTVGLVLDQRVFREEVLNSPGYFSPIAEAI